MSNIYFNFVLDEGSSCDEYCKIEDGVGYLYDFDAREAVRNDVVVDWWENNQDRCIPRSQEYWETHIRLL